MSYDHQERLERENANHATHLAEVETQIKFHQDEIDKLKDIHRRLQAIDKIIHPPPPAPKVKVKQNGKPQQVSEETLSSAIEWLRRYFPEEEFYASLLNENPDWQVSSSHTNKILAELWDRSQIRLTSKGIGGRKNFRVVT